VGTPGKEKAVRRELIVITVSVTGLCDRLERRLPRRRVRNLFRGVEFLNQLVVRVFPEKEMASVYIAGVGREADDERDGKQL